MSNEIVQGDNGSILELVIQDGQQVINLTNASVQVVLTYKTTGKIKPAVITDAINGKCEVTLTTEDVMFDGTYAFQATVTFEDGRKFTSNVQRFNVAKKIGFIPNTGGGSGGSTEVVGGTNGHILVNGIDVKVYDDATVKSDISTLKDSDLIFNNSISNINDSLSSMNTDVIDLKNNKHTHSNLSTLNLISDNGTNLLFNGSKIGSEITTSTTNGNIKVDTVEFKVYDDTQVKQDISGKAPALHSHSSSDITDFDTTAKTNGYVLTYEEASGKFKPKPFTTGATYVLELSRWAVKNDGTDEVNTTNGLNNAMTWASQNGYSGMILPFGTYLIDPALTVNPPSYFTLDLNGSTLQLKTSNSTKHAVISIANNQKYTRVTNGKIRGDKDTHNFAGNMTQYDGYGIQLGTFTSGNPNNVKFIALDNLEISNFIGDSITINSAFNQISPLPTALASSWESGGINATTGALEANTTVIRSTLNVDLTQSLISQYGYFGLYGNGFGGLGADITTDYYDVFFYQSDNTFISTSTFNQFFEEVEIPAGANYAKVVLHQPAIPAAANCTITLRVPTFPQFVFIEKCNMHHNRRQGISVCGAKNIYIKENEIHHIGGSTSLLGIDPQAGIDIEDGYDLNQNIHVDGNLFHHNYKYNLIAVNGKNIYITNNTLLATLNAGYVSLTINSGVDKAAVTGNTIKLGKVLFTGETLFSNNYVYGTQVTANPPSNKPVNVLNNTFHNCKFVFDSPTAYLVKVDNCRFFNDVDKSSNQFTSLAWTLELKNTPQTISNCVFDGQDYSYLISSAAGTYQGGWRFEHCRFKNTKSPNLYSGIYIGCTFTDLVGSMQIVSQTGGLDSLELRSCKFYNTDSNNTIFTFNSMKSLQIVDCYFEKTSGWMMKIGTVSGEVLLRGNTIKILNDALPRSIVILDSTFNGTSIIMEDNKISATNSPRVGIDNLTTNTSTIILRGNVLTKASINKNNKEIMLNNILDGVPVTGLTGTASPTTVPQFVGQTYVDTTNKVSYMAVGTSASTDWKQISN